MKEYLQRGWKLREEINKKKKELRFWRNLATSTGRTGTGSGGNTQSKIELATINIVDLENEIIKDLEKLAGIEIETLKYIKKLNLDELDKTLLQMRYVGYQNWHDISNVLGYAESYMLERHKKALNSIAQHR